jgi:hypothetical protein
MGFWDFHQTADHGWQWRYMPENTANIVSGGHFQSRNDCIADAMRHGYLSETVPCTKGSEPASGGKDLPADTPMADFLNRLRGA